jgi:hypothetical protein
MGGVGGILQAVPFGGGPPGLADGRAGTATCEQHEGIFVVKFNSTYHFLVFCDERRLGPQIDNDVSVLRIVQTPLTFLSR